MQSVDVLLSSKYNSADIQKLCASQKRLGLAIQYFENMTSFLKTTCSRSDFKGNIVCIEPVCKYTLKEL